MQKQTRSIFREMHDDFRKIGGGFGGELEDGLSNALSKIKPIRIPVLLIAAGDVLTSAIGPLIGLVGQVGAGVFAMGTQVASASASLLALAGAAGKAVGALGAVPTLAASGGLAFGALALSASGMKGA